MNCRDWIFTHAFSESSSKAYGKNGLGRRDTKHPMAEAVNYAPRAVD
jgi:hypothetical protein